MELSSISIKQFKQQMSAQTTCYRDDILISNHVERLEPFRYPRRIFATLVLFCLDGELEFSINLKRYHITSNMMVIAFAGDIIQIHRVEVLEAYAILLSSNYLNDLQIDFRQRSKFYIDAHNNAILRIPYTELMTIAPYYSLLKTNMEKNRAESPEILHGLVRAFSYTVISIMQVYRKNDDEINPDAILRSQQLFDKFMALIKLHHTAE